MSDRMNQHDQQPPDCDELRDRLIDAALRERLGGETPPDLSATILTRAAAAPAIRPSTSEATMATPSSNSPLRAWRFLFIAATLLIAIGMLLLLVPSIQARREAARRSLPSIELPESSAKSRPSRSNVFSSSQAERSSGPSDALPEGESGKPTRAENDQKFLAARGAKVDVLEELAAAPNVDAEVFKEAAVSSGQHLPQTAAGGRASYFDSMDQMESALEKNVMLESNSGRPENFGYDPRNRQERPRQAAQESKFLDIRSTAAAPATPSTELDNYRLDLDQPFRQGSFSTDEDGHFVHSGEGSNQHRAIEAAKLKNQLKELDVEVEALVSSRNENPDELRQQVIERHIERKALNARLRSLQAEARAQANRDQYARINDNPFLPVSAANTDHRLSTFSIDVDTASYANVRQFLMQSGTLPPPDAVRIEELVNYFDYDYTPPTGDVPFAANVEVAGCPWAPEHRLVRVGIKGREIERTQRPLSNLVFLIDVSGSMDEPNKLPLLVEGMKQLTRELGENDRVAIVVYASSEGLALESTSGTDQSKILAALDQLRAGGSTAGGAGIQLAYQIAQKNFIKGAVNRVILCTDGDFNVGVTSPAELERMAETNAKETGVFLTVLGFGRGNLNDTMIEQVADKGNGNYHYIDTRREAGKVLVEEMAGTLVTIAKDVKIQVEFNPAKVAGYRLVGYENRVLAAEDFNDDKKDAGEIGAGHTVTALYEIVPVGEPVASASVDEFKYAPGEDPLQRSGDPGKDVKAKTASDADAANELLTLKIRYKAPDGDVSSKLEFPIVDAGGSFAQASEDFKFASSVASFGMLLRNSEHKGNATYAGVIETAAAASKDRDPHGYRQEFVEIVRRAQELAGE